MCQKHFTVQNFALLSSKVYLEFYSPFGAEWFAGYFPICLLKPVDKESFTIVPNTCLPWAGLNLWYYIMVYGLIFKLIKSIRTLCMIEGIIYEYLVSKYNNWHMIFDIHQYFLWELCLGVSMWRIWVHHYMIVFRCIYVEDRSTPLPGIPLPPPSTDYSLSQKATLVTPLHRLGRSHDEQGERSEVSSCHGQTTSGKSFPLGATQREDHSYQGPPLWLL